MWFDILSVRYGASVVSSLQGGRSFGFCSCSTWRKGVSLLGSKKYDLLNWFELGFVKNVGTGFQTSIWEDPLLGITLFKVRFPCLFSISQFKNGL